MSLVGRTAVITAAGSGIGRSAAALFAAHGAHVVVVDIDRAGAGETVAQIQAEGGSAEASAVDLLDGEEVDAFAADLASRRDVVDILFNHAGGPGPQGLDCDFAAWQRSMTLNVWVPMVMTERLLPLLRRSTSASVIFTSSTSGLVASPNSPTYAAAKGAVVQLMKSIAVLLAPEGIRANAICPGATDTPMLPTFYGAKDFNDPATRERLERYVASVPLGRLAGPGEIASVALFLASDASSYLTGAAIPVDGGFVAR